MELKTIADLRRARPEHVVALQKTFSFVEDFKAFLVKHRNRRSSEDEVKTVECRSCEGTGEVTIYPRRTHVAHPSSFSPYACLQRIWYDIMGDLEEISNFDASLLLTFDHGHSVHDMLQTAAHKMYGDAFKSEVRVYIDEWLTSGSADGVFDFKALRFGWEIKTINDRGFKDLSGPKTQHRWQAHAYMKGLDLPFMLFLYFNKDTGQMMEYWLNFNDTTWELVEGMLKEVFDADDSTGPGPYRPNGGGKINKFACKDCVYNHGCPHTLYTKNKRR